MNAFEPSTLTFLFTDAVLLLVSVLQAVLGILFFRPFAAVTLFFLQCLFLFTGAVITLGFSDMPFRFWGWGCLVAFAPLFIMGFRFWRRPAAPAPSEPAPPKERIQRMPPGRKRA